MPWTVGCGERRSRWPRGKIALHPQAPMRSSRSSSRPQGSAFIYHTSTHTPNRAVSYLEGEALPPSQCKQTPAPNLD